MTMPECATLRGNAYGAQTFAFPVRVMLSSPLFGGTCCLRAPSSAAPIARILASMLLSKIMLGYYSRHATGRVAVRTETVRGRR